MVQADVLLTPLVREPSVACAVSVVRLSKMRMRCLDRCDNKPVAGDRSRLPHHVTLVGTVTVNGDQQRGSSRQIRRYIKVVIEFDLGSNAEVGLQLFVGHICRYLLML